MFSILYKYIVYISIISFLGILSLSLKGCIMPYFDKDGTYPLHLIIETVLENRNIKFKIKERHISLENYYLANINVNTSNSSCNEKYKKGLTIWNYKPNLPQEKISVLSKIPYNGEKSILKKNTLYTVTVQIQKIQDSKYGRIGIGAGVFVLKDNGNVLYGNNYADINKLCKEYYK